MIAVKVYSGDNGRGVAYSDNFTAATITIGPAHPFAVMGLDGFTYVTNIGASRHGTGEGSAVLRAIIDAARSSGRPGVCIKPTPVAGRPISVDSMFAWFARIGMIERVGALAVIRF